MRVWKYIAVFCVLAPVGGYAQIIEETDNDCLNKLSQAEERYKAGNVEEIPTLILECYETNNIKDKSKKIQALRLLVNAYIFEHKQDSADLYMQKLLKLNPEFAPNTTIDRREFINLYSTFTTNPILGIGLKGGVNTLFVQELQQRTVGNDLNSGVSSYKLTPGFDVELNFTYYLKWKGSLDASIGFSQFGFSQESTVMQSSSLFPDMSSTSLTSTTFRIQNLTASIGGSWLPGHSLSKRVFGSIRPNLSMTYLMSVDAEAARNYTDLPTTSDARPIPEEGQSVKALFNSFGYYAGLDAGVNIRIPKGRISFEFCYKYQINNLQGSDVYQGFTSNDSGSDTKTYLFSYYSVMNAMRAHYVGFKIGYLFHTYNPKKIK